MEGIEILGGAARRFPHRQQDTKKNSTERPEQQGILADASYLHPHFSKQSIHYIYTLTCMTADTPLNQMQKLQSLYK